MNFREDQIEKQVEWWKSFSNNPDWEKEKNKWGEQNKRACKHIIKSSDWQKLIWNEINEKLQTYIKNRIQKHTGTHNMLSSWAACANLYFPIRCFDDFQKLLVEFLISKTRKDIKRILAVELEFALDGELSPKELLGEEDGIRGSGQTSPDVAFLVETKSGKGLFLTECKYTEHSFYRCSARRNQVRGDKPANPDPSKCLMPAISTKYISIPCHQHVWGRKYFDHFNLSEYGKQILTKCPAAVTGYQLFRQQALANGILNNGGYEFVFSSVAWDKRNTSLKNCLSSSGIEDFESEWQKIYDCGAKFLVWNHQEWVEFVRKQGIDSQIVKSWLLYINSRYGY